MKKVLLSLVVLASCNTDASEVYVAQTTPKLAPTGAHDPQMDQPEAASPEIALEATTTSVTPSLSPSDTSPEFVPPRPVQREVSSPTTVISRVTTRNVSSTPPEYVKQCESDGDYTEVNPNGHYGAWQFSQSTWESVGGTGRPDRASPAEQDYRASILWDGGNGASHWESCL